MKARMLIACAIAAVPFTGAWATMPSGPQGTGWYGAPNAAVPVPQQQPFAHNPNIYGQTPPTYGQAPQAYGQPQDWRNTPQARAPERDGMNYPWYRESRIPVLQGHSADTNPPAPAP